jgi:hypothetical protein
MCVRRVIPVETLDLIREILHRLEDSNARGAERVETVANVHNMSN